MRGCDSDWCTHCLNPFLLVEQGGSYHTVIDHHVVEMNSAYDNWQAKCLWNTENSVFQLERGVTLTFIDSAIVDVRYKMRAFVILLGASLQLIRSNVTRVDPRLSFIYPIDDPVNLIILQDCLITGLNRDHAYTSDMSKEAHFIETPHSIRLTISRCVFSENVVMDPLEGGDLLIAADLTERFEVVDTVFTHCIGGLRFWLRGSEVSLFRNVSFEGNFAFHGLIRLFSDANICGTEMTTCQFIDNHSSKSIISGRLTTIASVVFRNNRIIGSSGVHVFDLGDGSLSLSNCTFEDNGAFDSSFKAYWTDYYLSKGLLNDEGLSESKAQYENQSSCRAALALSSWEHQQSLAHITLSDSHITACRVSLSITSAFDPSIVLLREAVLSSGAQFALTIQINSDSEGQVRIEDSVLEKAGVLLTYSAWSLALQLAAFNVTFQNAKGGLLYYGNVDILWSNASFTRCEWLNNEGNRAAGVGVTYGSVYVRDCVFRNNSCWACVGDLLYDTSTVVVENCLFEQSHSFLGTSSIAVMGNIPEAAFISNCTFKWAVAESGAVIRTEHISGTLYLSDLRFQNIVSSSTSLVLITPPISTDQITVVISALQVQNSTFYRGIEVQTRTQQVEVVSRAALFAGNTGSLVWITAGSYSETDSVFNANTASEALLFQGRNTFLTLSSVVFTGNRLLGTASIVRSEGPHTLVICTFCQFTENNSPSGLVQLQAARASFRSSRFHSNQGVAISSQSNSSLSLQECVFGNHSHSLLLQNTSAIVLDCSFANIRVRVFTLIQSNLQVLKTNISELQGDGICALTAKDSVVQLKEVRIEDWTCRQEAVQMTNSSVTLENCLVQRVSNGTHLMSLSHSSLLLSNVQVFDVNSFQPLFSLANTNANLSAVAVSGTYAQVLESTQAEVRLERSNFTQINTLQAVGVLACYSCTQVLVSNCRFEHIKANSVAGIKITSLTALFRAQYSQFSDLHAKDSGALRVSADHVVISDTSMSNNSADGVYSSGGALQLNASQTLLQRVTFTNNSAYSGGALHWLVNQPDFTETTFHDNSAVYGPDQASRPSALWSDSSYLRLNSGETFTEVLQVLLVDILNQTVFTDSQTQAFLESSALSGKTYTIASAGKLQFTGFSARYQPGDQLNISVVAGSLKYPITLIFRACDPGEMLSNQTCVLCPTATYSFSHGALRCTVCPSGAECPGGAQFYPSPGYWRPSVLYEDVFRCPRSESCLGHERLTSLTGACEELYSGHMCQICVDNTFREGRDFCSECPGSVEIKLQAVFLSLVMLGIWQLLAWSSALPSSRVGVLLRILFHYMQLVTLVTDFQLNWPAAFKDYLTVHHYLSNILQHFVPLDCLYSQAFYIRTIAAALVPPCIVSFYALFWLFFRLVKLPITSLGQKVLNLMIVGYAYVYPFLLRVAFSDFLCVEIEPGEQWLREEMAIPCWKNEHYTYSLAASLPSILLWGAGIPGLALFLLMKYRNKPTERLNAAVFLQQGLKEHAWFWEVGASVFKACVAVLYVFSANATPFAQALSLVLLLSLAVLLQWRYKPYQETAFNRTALYSLVLVWSTAYAGLYFSSSANNTPLLTLLFTLHFWFALYWATSLCNITLKSILLKFFPSRIAS